MTPAKLPLLMRVSLSVSILLLAFTSIMGAIPQALSPLKIIAHRGASAYAPENTLSAFRTALEMNADGIELDVHVSADRKLMVIHDAHTGRTSNQQLVIKETHSQELRTLDVGKWKGLKWEGEHIPFLEEALDLVPPDKELFIECKSEDPEAFLGALDDLWDRYETRLESSTFISFHPQILWALKQARPHLVTLLLIEDTETLKYYNSFIVENSENPFDGAGIEASLKINDNWVLLMKNQSRILSVWTVNTPEVAQVYETWDFRYLTTDKPDLFVSKNIQESS